MAARGKTEEFILAGRKCVCFIPESVVRHAAVLCGWRMAELLPVLSEEIPETVLFCAEADGGRDFTPWPAEAVWDGDPFYGEAEKYLRFLEEAVMPYLEEHFEITEKKRSNDRGLFLGRIIFDMGGV